MPARNDASELPPIAYTYRPKRVCESTNQPAANTTSIVSTGTGTPSSFSRPRNPKPAGRSLTDVDPENQSATMNDNPRAMVSTASVTTNGGTLNREIVIPVNEPQTAPTASDARIPTKTPESPKFLAHIAAANPASARTDPTERSMPPVRITNVIPTARTPVIAMLSPTLRRFSTDKNCGESNAKTTASATIASRMMYFWNIPSLICSVSYRKFQNSKFQDSSSKRPGIMESEILESLPACADVT